MRTEPDEEDGWALPLDTTLILAAFLLPFAACMFPVLAGIFAQAYITWALFGSALCLGGFGALLACIFRGQRITITVQSSGMTISFGKGSLEVRNDGGIRIDDPKKPRRPRLRPVK